MNPTPSAKGHPPDPEPTTLISITCYNMGAPNHWKTFPCLNAGARGRVNVVPMPLIPDRPRNSSACDDGTTQPCIRKHGEGYSEHGRQAGISAEGRSLYELQLHNVVIT